MIVTKLAVALGVVAFGLLCWMAVAGVTFAAVLIITVGALVVLVGGGNWIGGRSSAGRGRQPPGVGPPSSTYVPPSGPPAGGPPTGSPPAGRPSAEGHGPPA
ncbi:MAG TPA: hypothetical protein VHB02_02280 [Acidimicrobiales bacterium]|nr:hypothetical protein [Acidimicrobiales bacterium]